MKELLQQIENRYNDLQKENTRLQDLCESSNTMEFTYREQVKSLSNRAYGLKIKVAKIEKLLDNKFYDSKDKVKIVRTLLSQMRVELNEMYQEKKGA